MGTISLEKPFHMLHSDLQEICLLDSAPLWERKLPENVHIFINTGWFKLIHHQKLYTRPHTDHHGQLNRMTADFLSEGIVVLRREAISTNQQPSDDSEVEPTNSLPKLYPRPTCWN